MAFKEQNFVLPTRHNPYLHEIILGELADKPKGRVLDVPSGPGYLVQDLNKAGFQALAAEIDEGLHCLPGVEYKPVDMVQRFPFADHEFDYVTSIEGIEHIENHLAFLREVKRVLKPGGLLLLTTPNVKSIGSRWNFFLSGFHLLQAKPIPLDTENIYFEHINPMGLDMLYFYCERVGLKIEKLKTHRYKRGSRLLYYLFYPFIRFGLYKACFLKERDAGRRKQNERIYELLTSKEALLGSHTIVVARAV